MKKRAKGIDMQKLFFWTPRILGILFIILMEIFVIISNGFTVMTLVENVFVMILLIALVLAWRWPLPGGIIYTFLAVAYILMAARRHLVPAMAFALPLFIAGVLFILDWEFRAKLKSR
ncbi:hypothetical protein ACFL3V_00370 [Nanoarchaeota archaeon]